MGKGELKKEKEGGKCVCVLYALYVVVLCAGEWWGVYVCVCVCVCVCGGRNLT